MGHEGRRIADEEMVVSGLESHGKKRQERLNGDRSMATEEGLVGSSILAHLKWIHWEEELRRGEQLHSHSHPKFGPRHKYLYGFDDSRLTIDNWHVTRRMDGTQE